MAGQLWSLSQMMPGIRPPLGSSEHKLRTLQLYRYLVTRTQPRQPGILAPFRATLCRQAAPTGGSRPGSPCDGKALDGGETRSAGAADDSDNSDNSNDDTTDSDDEPDSVGPDPGLTKFPIRSALSVEPLTLEKARYEIDKLDTKLLSSSAGDQHLFGEEVERWGKSFMECFETRFFALDPWDGPIHEMHACALNGSVDGPPPRQSVVAPSPLATIKAAHNRLVESRLGIDQTLRKLFRHTS